MRTKFKPWAEPYINEHPDFDVCGDTKQLGMESKPYDIIANLAHFTDDDLVDNLFKVNPVYLKELI